MEKSKSTDCLELEHHHLKGYSKCMIAGGYAVVFEGHQALVLKTNDYYESFIIKDKNDLENGKIRISSPQYTSKPSFVYHYKGGHSFEADSDNKNQNLFIEGALKSVLLYFYSLDKEKIENFFSENSINIQVYQTGNYLRKSHLTGNTINNFPEIDGEPHSCKKTGIGSSSSFLVSLTKSLYFSFRKKLNIRIIHFLAQVANSIAQNKIGSGFDITCATYGSVIFERIMKFHFEYFLRLVEKENYDFGEKVNEYCKDDDNHLPVPVSMKHLAITLLEYSKGFDTRIAVKQVLDYFKEHLEERSHFLEKSNYFTQQILSILKMPVVDRSELVTTNRAYRKLLKEAGNLTKVEIEPDFASFLIEYLLENLEGEILYAICPGAGGYDAIAIVSYANIQEELKAKIDTLLNSQLKQDPDLAPFFDSNRYLSSFKLSASDPDFKEKLNKLSVNVI